MSTVGEELRFNPRLMRSRKEFIEIMSRLSLPYPKQIGECCFEWIDCAEIGSGMYCICTDIGWFDSDIRD